MKPKKIHILEDWLSVKPLCNQLASDRIPADVVFNLPHQDKMLLCKTCVMLFNANFAGKKKLNIPNKT